MAAAAAYWYLMKPNTQKNEGKQEVRVGNMEHTLTLRLILIAIQNPQSCTAQLVGDETHLQRDERLCN